MLPSRDGEVDGLKDVGAPDLLRLTRWSTRERARQQIEEELRSRSRSIRRRAPEWIPVAGLA